MHFPFACTRVRDECGWMGDRTIERTNDVLYICGAGRMSENSTCMMCMFQLHLAIGIRLFENIENVHLKWVRPRKTNVNNAEYFHRFRSGIGLRLKPSSKNTHTHMYGWVRCIYSSEWLLFDSVLFNKYIVNNSVFKFDKELRVCARCTILRDGENTYTP